MSGTYWMSLLTVRAATYRYLQPPEPRYRPSPAATLHDQGAPSSRSRPREPRDTT